MSGLIVMASISASVDPSVTHGRMVWGPARALGGFLLRSASAAASAAAASAAAASIATASWASNSNLSAVSLVHASSKLAPSP